MIFSLSALKEAVLSIPSSCQILTHNCGALRQLGTVLQLMITQARGSDCAPSMKENSGILSFEVLHILSEAILIFFSLLPLSHAASINVLPIYQSFIWEKKRETVRMEKRAREGGKEERKRDRDRQTKRYRQHYRIHPPLAMRHYLSASLPLYQQGTVGGEAGIYK